MIEILISKNKYLKANEVKQIKEITKIISQELKIINPTMIELSIINELEMQALCLKYYQTKKTTDVLSFNNEFQLDEKTIHLGEVFVNYEQVKIQAQLYEHSYKRELFYLIIHGILHLLKYDHQNPEEEKQMNDLQNAILKIAKIGK
ncbi:MAG: rRNA maturation RNase YbeY [Mycoplasmoidaceae bacterium]